MKRLLFAPVIFTLIAAVWFAAPAVTGGAPSLRAADTLSDPLAPAPASRHQVFRTDFNTAGNLEGWNIMRQPANTSVQVSNGYLELSTLGPAAQYPVVEHTAIPWPAGDMEIEWRFSSPDAAARSGFGVNTWVTNGLTKIGGYGIHGGPAGYIWSEADSAGSVQQGLDTAWHTALIIRHGGVYDFYVDGGYKASWAYASAPTWTAIGDASTQSAGLWPTIRLDYYAVYDYLATECQDLIVNGNMESNTAWEFPVTAYPAGYATSHWYSYARSIRTGIESGADVYSYSSGYQQVTIPANTGSAALHFRWFPVSAELAAGAILSPPVPSRETLQAFSAGEMPESGIAPGDVHYVLVLDQDGTILQTLIWILSNAGTWQSATFDLKAYAGETIRLHFGTYNDGNGLKSAMYVDDVSLIQCPNGTPAPDGARIFVDPATLTTLPGSIFTVDLKVDAWTYPVDTVQTYLSFDPEFLQVVDANGDPASTITGDLSVLDQPLANSADNTTGIVRYDAGKLGGTATGTFRIATVRFLALKVTTPKTQVLFEPPTDVFSAGASVLDTTAGAEITVQALSCIDGRIAFQGHSPPGEVTITLYPPAGTVPSAAYTASANAVGILQICGEAGKTYDVKVKSSHSLSNRRSGVTIPASGPAPGVVDLCTLREGDADDDDRVSGVDVSILVTTYGKSLGDAGFDARADFNDDAVVNAADFSLLSSNYNRNGPLACPVPAAAGAEAITAPLGTPRVTQTTGGIPVMLSLVPNAQRGAEGDIVTLDLLLETGDQPVSNVELYATFDTAALQVVDANGNPASAIVPDTGVLDGVLLNVASNDTGTIRYDAMQPLGGQSPSGTFRVATTRFKVLSEANQAQVRYVQGSEAFYGGNYLEVTLGSATVNLSTQSYLPLVLR
jgi:hypothetical protein